MWIKLIGEALQRVALGLSRNTSVTAPELLLYLHATLQPFVLTVVREKENQKRVKGMLDRPKIAKEDAGGDHCHSISKRISHSCFIEMSSLICRQS